MKTKTRIVYSGLQYGKAYLPPAWANRHALHERERRGLYQFTYIVLHGHIESLLSSLLNARLRAINSFIKAGLMPEITRNEFGRDQVVSMTPLFSSLSFLSNSLMEEVEKAPISRLRDLYRQLHGKGLSEILGKDLNEDIEALTAMRNIFAHGRDVIMDFNGDSLSSDVSKFSWDENPLQRVANRLIKVGVIKGFRLSSTEADKFAGYFLCEKATLHFYDAVVSADRLIREHASSDCDVGGVVTPLMKLK